MVCVTYLTIHAFDLCLIIDRYYTTILSSAMLYLYENAELGEKQIQVGHALGRTLLFYDKCKDTTLVNSITATFFFCDSVQSSKCLFHMSDDDVLKFKEGCGR